MWIISKTATGIIYHRPECRYAKRIYKKNKLKMTLEDVKWNGCHPCKCCCKAEFVFRQQKRGVNKFAAQNRMDVDWRDGKIYIRTEAGCWKLIFQRREQQFLLFHRNNTYERISLDDVEKRAYHRQSDVAGTSHIMMFMQYINAHDMVKQRTKGDYHKMPQDTKQQKAYYKAAKRRAAKRSARRVDRIFALLEQEEGFQKLSFC